jgi:hypothetical protein
MSPAVSDGYGLGSAPRARFPCTTLPAGLVQPGLTRLPCAVPIELTDIRAAKVGGASDAGRSAVIYAGPMKRGEPQSAIEYLDAVIESAHHLADHGLVIMRAQVDWGSFGSWVLDVSAGSGGPTYRGVWDGRDGELQIRRDDVPVERLQFSSSDDALRHTEQFLLGNGDASEPDRRSGDSPAR